MSSVHPTLRNRRRRSIGSGCPWLIAVGCHVFYVLSKMGTAKHAIGGRFGRASSPVLEFPLLTCDLTLTGHRDQLHPSGEFPT